MGAQISKNESVVDVATSIVNNVTNDVLNSATKTVTNTQSIDINLNELNKTCGNMIASVDCKKDPKNMACNKEFMKAFCSNNIGEIKQNIKQTVKFDDKLTNDLSNKIYAELKKKIEQETTMTVSKSSLVAVEMQKNLTKINDSLTNNLVNKSVTESVQSYTNNQIIQLNGAVPTGVYQDVSSNIISTSIVDNIMKNDSDIRSAVDAINKMKYESKGFFDMGLGGFIALGVIFFIIIVIIIVKQILSRRSNNDTSSFGYNNPQFIPMAMPMKPPSRFQRFKSLFRRPVRNKVQPIVGPSDDMIL